MELAHSGLTSSPRRRQALQVNLGSSECVERPRHGSEPQDQRVRGVRTTWGRGRGENEEASRKALKAKILDAAAAPADHRARLFALAGQLKLERSYLLILEPRLVRVVAGWRDISALPANTESVSPE